MWVHRGDGEGGVASGGLLVGGKEEDTNLVRSDLQLRAFLLQGSPGSL